MGFIFGQGTPWTYDDIARKRSQADAIAQSLTRTPQNVGEGLNAIGQALMARGIDKRASKREAELDAEWKTRVGGMGLDPQRQAIFEALRPGQRDSAVLGWLDRQDAERRAAASRATSAANADKNAPNMDIISAITGDGVVTQEELVQALGQGANKATMDMLGGVMTKPDAGGGTEYGLTPQFITTEEGGLQMIQLSKDGTAKVVDLPEGAAIQKGVEKLDLGTTYQWYNTITGQPIGEPIPKDLEGAARDTAIGKGKGEAEVAAVANLPKVEAQAGEAIGLIDTIINDPALESITGMVQGRMPPLTQAGTDLDVKIKQLKGQVFLQAYESLRGAAAITDIEGKKAEEAKARLERAQSATEYVAALNDLKSVIESGLDLARKNAGAATPSQPQTPRPTDWKPKGWGSEWNFLSDEQKDRAWGLSQ